MLAQCCRRAKWDEVMRMLGEEVNVDEPFGNLHYVAMHYVAMHGALEIAKLLVGRGCNVNAVGKDGLSPLHLSVQNHKNDMSVFLVASGADVNLLDMKGNPPFFGAPWHTILYPCLIAPAHKNLSASITACVDLQSRNLHFRQQILHYERRISEARAKTFITCTELFDSRKHREAVDEDIIQLNHEVRDVEDKVAKQNAVMNDLVRDKADCEALLTETEAATLSKQVESKFLWEEKSAVELEESRTQSELSTVQNHIRDKCESLACVTLMSGNERLLQHSFRALTRLSMVPDLMQKLAQNNLIIVILSGLEIYPKNVQIQIDGLRVLFQFVTSTGNIPSALLQRSVCAVSSTLLLLRSTAVVDYANDVNLDAVESFVHLTTIAGAEDHLLRPIYDSLRSMHKQNSLRKNKSITKPAEDDERTFVQDL
ncbi:unnamed protein product [Aphanomyces euteiches]